MTRHTQEERERVAEALSARKAALLAELSSALQESGDTQYAEVLGKHSGDSSDEALAVTLGDLAHARLDMELQELKRLQAAQVRLATDAFGLCEDCGVPIPLARLLANPAALRCIACQEILEKHG